MMWRQAELFWLFVVVAAVAGMLVYALRRRAAALRGFADDLLVERLARGWSDRRRAVRLSLRVAALAVLVVALAGPKWGFHWEEVRREGIDLIVAIDTSRSMLATDVKPNRLERAKLAVLDLIPRLRGDRIGLVAYAGAAFLEAPLTLDYAAFSRSLRALQVGIIPRGGTALSRAIDTSLDGFEARQGKYEALILITDGEDHEGDAAAAAKKAAERGVKIYTVGIGTPEGELLPLQGDARGYVKDRKGQVVKSRLNETLLRDLALDTGGAYVRGLGPQLGLDQVFDEHIAKMERREVDAGLERRFEERFQLPLLIALLLLFLETAVGDRKREPWPLRGRGWASRLARRLRRAPALVLLPIVVPMVLLGSVRGAAAGLFDTEPDPINAGVDLYAEGKYADAVTKFGDALVESPASPLLQFDLAAALFKAGRYGDAISSLEKVVAEGGAEWSASANYNLGNAHFRAGSEAEEKEPQRALESWAQSLLAYRRAMAADPAMEDVKFNYELVQRRIEELRERLEQEKQEQEQQEQDKQEQEQQGDEGAPEEKPDEQQQEQQQDQQGEEEKQDQQGEEEKQDQQGEEEKQEQPQDGEQPPDGEQGPQDEQPPQEEQGTGEEQEQPPPQQGDQEEQGEQDQEQQPDGAEEQESAGGESEQPPEAAGEPGQATAGAEAAPSEEQVAAEQAAHAVLDLARDEELGPEEVGRKVGIAGLGDPREDW